MRAVADLAAGDVCRLLPLLFSDQVLEETRSDYVGSLAYDERAGGVVGFDQIDAGVVGAMRGRRRGAGFPSGNRGRDGGDVGRRCAAASTYEIQPAVVYEFGELVGYGTGGLVVAELVVGQTGVRIAGNAGRSHFVHGPEMIGHELGAGAAVESNGQKIGVGDAGAEGIGCLAAQHGAHGFNGAGDHYRDFVADFPFYLLNGQQGGFYVSGVLAGFH